MLDVFVKRLHMLGGGEAFLTSCINSDKNFKYKKFSGKRLALNRGTVCSFFLAKYMKRNTRFCSIKILSRYVLPA